jgi:hypothetical protein
MNDKIFSLIVVLVGFGIIATVIAIKLLMLVFDYQDQLIIANQKIYELNQTIEMYQLYTGELK